jgi:hypothetical protein
VPDGCHPEYLEPTPGEQCLLRLVGHPGVERQHDLGAEGFASLPGTITTFDGSSFGRSVSTGQGGRDISPLATSFFAGAQARVQIRTDAVIIRILMPHAWECI